MGSTSRLSASKDHWICQVLPLIWSKRIKVYIFWVGWRANLPVVLSLSGDKLTLFKIVVNLDSSLFENCTCHIFPLRVSSSIKLYILAVLYNLKFEVEDSSAKDMFAKENKSKKNIIVKVVRLKVFLNTVTLLSKIISSNLFRTLVRKYI